MKFPTSPMARNDLLIAAVCADGLRLGPASKAVAEIAKQLRGVPASPSGCHPFGAEPVVSGKAGIPNAGCGA